MYYGFPKYESIAEKKANNLQALHKYQKKHADANPIILTGNKIATSFWGKAWCDNLKYYADYDNRIERGRSYIKQGAVIDLKISPKLIKSVVCGSQSKIYQIHIQIDLINDDRLVKKIGNSIDDLEALADGQFPKNLAQTFLTRENGLFPTLQELKSSCSCPDYANICKHISATLYAVGALLDKEPLLLFSLRGVDTSALIQKSVNDKLASLLQNANQSKSSRIIESQEIIQLFNLSHHF